MHMAASEFTGATVADADIFANIQNGNDSIVESVSLSVVCLFSYSRTV